MRSAWSILTEKLDGEVLTKTLNRPLSNDELQEALQKFAELLEEEAADHPQYDKLKEAFDVLLDIILKVVPRKKTGEADEEAPWRKNWNDYWKSQKGSK